LKYLLIFLLLTTNTQADTCGLLQALTQELSRGFVSPLETTTLSTHTRYKLEYKMPDGDSAGNLTYSIYKDDPKTIHVDYLMVWPKYRNKGINNEFFEAAVKAHPEVKFMEGEMAGTNFNEFQKAFEQFSFIRNTFERCKTAIRSTPAYKARAKVGFINILKCEVNGEWVSIIMGR